MNVSIGFFNPCPVWGRNIHPHPESWNVSKNKADNDFKFDLPLPATILYIFKKENQVTMDFRPREAPFFGDYFFRFGPIAFKFSHTSFQPKRRFLSIWSVNKKSIIRVAVIAS